jgi:hypothetical protein
LTADAFVKTLMFAQYDNKTTSLNDLVSVLNLRHEVNITKQALDQRFTEGSVLFLKQLVEKFLREVLPKESELEQFSPFKTVRIKDSTCFQLPKEYVGTYPGSGGAASSAMIRIQFEYDFKSGEIFDLSLHAFNDQDQTNTIETLGNINEGDLIMRDLGYINMKYLHAVIIAKAYYLNRPGSNINIYEKTRNGAFEKLDYCKIRNEMKNNGTGTIEKEVYLSDDKSIRTRLVIELLPEKEVAKRIRKAKKEAKKKKRQLSKNYINRAYLNLFITNIPAATVETKKIRTLYRIRWQVELIFKTWKSFSQLHRIKQMKIERFNTNLYATLLLILMNWKILWEAYSWYWENQRVFVSLVKFYKRLVGQQAEIRIGLQQGRESLAGELVKLFALPPTMVRLEKKKGKLSLLDILLMN